MMLTHLRHRSRCALRTGLLLAFALSVPLQAVLGVLSELHESTHVASAGLHADHLTPHHEESTEDSRENRNGILHLLLHHVHCCGLSFGLAAAELTTPLIEPVPAQPIPHLSPHTPTSHLTAPFRPPIPV